ncbi:MAG: AAA family ATPase, partial [Planctomycetaceae bacterium]|nr:AAA family ATPase [Planctomycetaceae bacterium]
QLLQRDPDQRPVTNVIASTLCPEHTPGNRDARSDASADSSLSSLSGQSGTLLIGRETQLAQLEQARETLMGTREPQVVFVRGRSGEGKTALVDRFLQVPRLSDEMVVLSGRCYDRESVPFKAIDCLIDALVAHLRSRADDQVRSLLPDDITMLAELFPVLRRVTAIAERSRRTRIGIDSRQIRYRAFAALRELFAAIGQSTPLILFIDDLQWGDADSAAALAEILKPPDAPAAMFLGSYRSDEAHESPFLQEWRQSESDISGTLIEIVPLTVEQCTTLLGLRLGRPTEELRQQAQLCWQSTKGNPYFLDQLLEGFDAESGEFTAVPLREILQQRLKRLPAEAGSILEAIAVAGQAIPLAEAAEVAEAMEHAFATVTHMRSEHLVRLIGSDEQQLVDTYHDKIRETVLEGMPGDQKNRLHIRFGKMLEQAENVTADTAWQFLEQNPLLEESPPPESDRIFDLAFHFHAAGDSRAFGYQFLAGELSFRAYASEDALEFFRRAESCCPAQASPIVQFRLQERLARCHQRLRQFKESSRRFHTSLEHAATSWQRAHVYECICEIHIGRSEYRQALQYFDRTLCELGLPRPVSISALLRCVPELLRLLLKPPAWKSRPEGTVEQRTRYLIYQRALNSMLLCIWELSDGMPSYPYMLLRMQTTATYVNGTEFWGKTVAHSAGQITLNGLPWLGRRLLKRTEAVANEIHDTEAKGFFLAGSAMANQYSNDRQLADQQYAQGYELLMKSGTHYYLGGVAHLHRHLHAVIAPATVELQTAQKTLRSAEAIGDSRTQCWGHYDIANALARLGRIAEALAEIELARVHLKPGERHLTDAVFLCTEGYVRLQASSYAAARFSLESAWQLARQRKSLMDVVVRCLPYLIESLLGPDWTQPVAPQQARRLRRLCRVASMVDFAYPNIASPAQRSRGRVFAALGKRQKAIHCFRKAVDRAVRCDGIYDRARSLLDLAAVEDDQRDKRRAEAVELLRQQESVLPRAEAWLLGDQYDERCLAAPMDVTDIKNAATHEAGGAPAATSG